MEDQNFSNRREQISLIKKKTIKNIPKKQRWDPTKKKTKM